MKMFDTELLKVLDNYAYNRPDIIPAEITRNDKSVYRIYFRFMGCVYMLYRNKILDKDTLANVKEQFISDLEIYNVLYRAMLQSARRREYLDNALINCNKNKDNCPACMEIYRAQTASIFEDKGIDLHGSE